MWVVQHSPRRHLGMVTVEAIPLHCIIIIIIIVNVTYLKSTPSLAIVLSSSEEAIKFNFGGKSLKRSS